MDADNKCPAARRLCRHRAHESSERARMAVAGGAETSVLRIVDVYRALGGNNRTEASRLGAIGTLTDEDFTNSRFASHRQQFCGWT